MKEIVVPTTINVSGATKTFGFGLAADSTAHLMRILRNTLYSDKVGACVREYITNARDSVVAAGGSVSKDIVITLPSHKDPVFRVQDFGLGLSEEEVQSIFVMYGASTKRNSNEFVGCLGLGSKSAFAYSDSFVVRSVKDGNVCIFQCSVADGGGEQDGKGRVSRMISSKTDERNGVTIEIPVRYSDFSAFQARYQNIVSYWEERPTVHSLSPLLYKEIKSDYGSRKDGWQISSNRSEETVAVMGGVPYPVNRNMIWNLLTQEQSRILGSNRSLVLWFDIGDLSITASREGLEYNERTKKTLAERCVKAYDSLMESLSKEIESPTSLPHARKIFDDIYCSGGWQRDFKLKKVVWKGKPIESAHIEFSEKDGASAFEVSPHFPKEMRWKTRFSIKGYKNPSSPVFVCLADVETRIKGRILRMLESGISKKILLIRFGGPLRKEDFLSENELDDSFFDAKLSDFESVQISRSPYSLSDKGMAKILLLSKRGCQKKECWQILSNPSEILDEREEKVYYVPIVRYVSTFNNVDFSPDDIFKILNLSEKMGLKIEELYGVKQSAVAKLPSNFINFFQVFGELCRKNSDLLKSISIYKYTPSFGDYFVINDLFQFSELMREISLSVGDKFDFFPSRFFGKEECAICGIFLGNSFNLPFENIEELKKKVELSAAISLTMRFSRYLSKEEAGKFARLIRLEREKSLDKGAENV